MLRSLVVRLGETAAVGLRDPGAALSFALCGAFRLENPRAGSAPRIAGLALGVVVAIAMALL